MAESVIPRSVISCFTEFKSASITGTYLTDGTIVYAICGKIMFFMARVKPKKAISTAIELVTVDSNDFTGFLYPIIYPVSEGTSSANTNSGKLAWTVSQTKQFRVTGQFQSGVNYYFGGCTMLV